MPIRQAINPGADDASAILFEVEDPMASPWKLLLHCEPFTVDGVQVDKLKPVAVGRDGKIHYFSNSVSTQSSMTMYSREDFKRDYQNDDAVLDANNVGIWSWDKLQNDVRVEAQPGVYRTDETYKSVFTWTFHIAP